MDEETGVAQLSDLLGQQLHPLHRVAEYDTLVNLELSGEGERWEGRGREVGGGRGGERG